MTTTTDHDRLRTLGRTIILVGGVIVVLGIGADQSDAFSDAIPGALALMGLGFLAIGTLLLLPPVRDLLLEIFPREPPARPGTLLLVAVWIGLLAGIAELLILSVQYRLGHRWGSLTSYDGAVTPLAYAALLVVPALMATLRTRFGPTRVGTLRFTVFITTWVAWTSLILLYHPELHLLVIPLIAAGLASRGSALASRYSRQLVRLARKTTLPLLILAAVLGTVPGATSRVAEARARAALAPAGEGAPNVLLIVWDTVRAANLSLYGYGRSTSPNLDRLAQEGVTFDFAISPASWTLPSHAGLFTGLNADELDVGWYRPLGSSPLTLAETLEKHGYLTAGFTGNRVYTGPHSGLDRGFQHFDAESFSLWMPLLGTRLTRWMTSLVLPEPGRPPASKTRHNSIRFRQQMGLKTAATVTNEFLAWSEDAGRRPFFAFLNYFEAHQPYYPPESFERRFDFDDPPLPPRHAERGIPLRGWSGLESYSRYDGAIASIDHELSRLLSELRSQGRLANTLVIVTADHGEEFGENGVFWHGRSLYMPTLHVPLVMVLPGRVPAGERISGPVTLSDVPATVIELLELDEQARFPGRSLATLWNVNDNAWRPRQGIYSALQGAPRKLSPEWGPFTSGDMTSLVIDGLHCIRNGDGSVELYDIEADPWEFDDLSNELDRQVPC